jgi:hypothetical protein
MGDWEAFEPRQIREGWDEQLFGHIELSDGLRRVHFEERTGRFMALEAWGAARTPSHFELQQVLKGALHFRRMSYPKLSESERAALDDFITLLDHELAPVAPLIERSVRPGEISVDDFIIDIEEHSYELESWF